MGQPENYVTCRCQNCDKGIEFNAADLSDQNSMIPCPHCGRETTLYVPPPGAPSHHTSILRSILSFGSQKSAVPPPILPTPIKLHWRGNELELAGEQVIIRKHSWAAARVYGMTGDRSISIASITAIQVQPANLFNPGRIIFSYPGSKPFTGGYEETKEDPDIFLFGTELNQQVEDFKNAVETIMSTMRQPAPPPLPARAPVSLPDEIRKLAELKQQGLLSDEEFEAAKKKLLG